MEEEKCLAPFLLLLLLLLLFLPPTSPPAHPSQHGKWTAASASVSILFPTIAVWPDIFFAINNNTEEVVVHFKKTKRRQSEQYLFNHHKRKAMDCLIITKKGTLIRSVQVTSKKMESGSDDSERELDCAL